MNKLIKELCTSGAFDLFVELMEEIQIPEVTYSQDQDVVYLLGKRDGALEWKDELIETIKKNAID